MLHLLYPFFPPFQPFISSTYLFLFNLFFYASPSLFSNSPPFGHPFQLHLFHPPSLLSNPLHFLPLLPSTLPAGICLKLLFTLNSVPSVIIIFHSKYSSSSYLLPLPYSFQSVLTSVPSSACPLAKINPPYTEHCSK